MKHWEKKSCLLKALGNEKRSGKKKVKKERTHERFVSNLLKRNLLSETLETKIMISESSRQ